MSAVKRVVAWSTGTVGRHGPLTDHGISIALAQPLVLRLEAQRLAEGVHRQAVMPVLTAS